MCSTVLLHYKIKRTSTTIKVIVFQLHNYGSERPERSGYTDLNFCCKKKSIYCDMKHIKDDWNKYHHGWCNR